MEPPNRPDPPPNLPAVPSRGPDADAPDPDPWESGRRRDPGSSGVPTWARRLRPRSVRLAVGLGILGAAVLLYPFAAASSQDDNYAWWLPIGLGVGTLALITLFRLDRVMFGWAPHVGGLVLVGTLVWQTSTNPWAWGLAVGAGVAVAGLLLLPRWQVLAVGAVLLVVFGVGYQFRSAEITEQRAQMDAQAGEQMRTVLGVPRPQLAVVSLDNGVLDNDQQRVCRILQDPAVDQLRAATGAVDCADAVARLHSRAAGAGVEATQPDRKADPAVAPGQATTVDACSTLWAATAGTGLGRVQLVRTDAPQQRFQVTGFAAC